MPSLVSVIIPTYNRAHCLGEAIDSVLAQDPPADEVIVIDDGSTDATPDVLAGYGDRITVLRQANAGAGAARTAGLRQASGDWITFLDSDDLWYPGRLALLHHDLERPQARDIVMHMADVRFTGEGYDHELFDLRGWPVGDGDAERVEDPLSRAISALHLNSFAARRDAAANTQGFPTELKISQDSYFMCAISAQGPALFSRTTVAEVRRIAGDDAANVELFRTDPVRARRIVQRRFDLLLDLPLTAAQHRLVRRHASGNLFKLAQAEAQSRTGRHRQTLIRMARTHPNPGVGWLKALPPLLLGQTGFEIVTRKKTGFSRVTGKA